MTSEDGTAGAAGQQRVSTDTDTLDEQVPDADQLNDDDDQADDDQGDDDEQDGDQADDDEQGGDYVSRLRRRIARYRTRATQTEQLADQLRRQLWTERVEALGLLADPADLPFDADALDDREAIREQAEELIRKRPHLRARRITGSVRQHDTGDTPNVSLGAILRAGA